MKKKLKIDNEKEMTYEEYIAAGEKLYNDIQKHILTREEYEEMLKRKKKIREWEHKIDELSKEYSEIFFEKVLKEEMKGVDFSYYGYYEISKYCIDEIMKNDKKIIKLFGTILARKYED